MFWSAEVIIQMCSSIILTISKQMFGIQLYLNYLSNFLIPQEATYFQFKILLQIWKYNGIVIYSV